MDPLHSSSPSTPVRLPRTRGDGPGEIVKALRDVKASPHTRGWTRVDGECRPARRGFPAHAGMDPTSTSRSGSRRRLPRTRGDGPRATSTCTRTPPASPHTRGWTPHRSPRRLSSRGFPAHAGMDPYRHAARTGSSGLPRTRGDGPGPRPGCTSASRASPHTRGWTPHQCQAACAIIGFPAHAGMDPRAVVALIDRDAASPHTRGWTLRAEDGDSRIVGFPAHAGMDPSRRRWRRGS